MRAYLFGPTNSAAVAITPATVPALTRVWPAPPRHDATRGEGEGEGPSVLRRGLRLSSDRR